MRPYHPRPLGHRIRRLAGPAVCAMALTLGGAIWPAAQAQEPAAPAPADSLRLNFRAAPIDTVLDYLSEAGGFVIVRDGSIPGTIDVVSHQPLSADEAVDVLQAILVDRGYGIVRNGRILRIVKRSDAKLHDLPVQTGRDPQVLPRDGQLVTQIVPIRHSTASKLIETLKPLLPPDTTITANDESNALVITDTQTNVRRLMEIVSALDRAVADLLEIAVIPLSHASPADTATIINSIYEEPASNSQNQSRAGFRRGGWGGFGGRGGGDDGGATTNDANDVKETATHVKAVADNRARAVIITAPGDVLPQIRTLVASLDIPTEAATALRIFPLRYADATEIANQLTALYTSASTSSTTNNTANTNDDGGGGRRGWFRRMQESMAQQNSNNTTTTGSNTALSEAPVVAVADTRTNAVIVSASEDTMADIAVIIQSLDATPANVPRVYIYRLENTDVTRAKEILDAMFDDLPATGTSGSRNSGNTTGGAATGRPGATTRNTGTTGNTGGGRATNTGAGGNTNAN